MVQSAAEIKQEIVGIGKRIYERGFVAANDGNISVRIGENAFYCTPTGISKGFMTPDMIIKIDAEGRKLEGELAPSSEIKMHLRVYRERPDVRAIVHAHPPVATAFTVAGVSPDQYILPEAILTIGAVPICVYGTPSTDEIPDSLMPYIQDHDAFLLKNHGALTVGDTLQRACFTMEEVEFNAKINLYARLISATAHAPIEQIPDGQLEKLMDLRRTLGMSGRHPGLRRAPATEASASRLPEGQEALVAEITRRVLEALGK